MTDQLILEWIEETCAAYCVPRPFAICEALEAARATAEQSDTAPIEMVLYCPNCGTQHIDAPDDRTPDWSNPPHRSHLCHECGAIWRPADVATVGVESTQTEGKADTWPNGIPDDARAASAITARDSVIDQSAAICQRLAVEALDSYTTEAGRTAAHAALICAMGEIRNLRAGNAGAEESTDAARDVLAERRRQIDVECWAPGRDDYVHEYGELADAAACYAHHSGMRSSEGLSGNLSEPFTFWPWASEWWKPTTPRRDLVKAGALILAEIERLDRLAAIESQRSGDGS